MAPGPTPTLIMSAPASINSLVPAAVTTLPATIGTRGFSALIVFNASTIFF